MEANKIRNLVILLLQTVDGLLIIISGWKICTPLCCVFEVPVVKLLPENKPWCDLPVPVPYRSRTSERTVPVRTVQRMYSSAWGRFLSSCVTQHVVYYDTYYRTKNNKHQRKSFVLFWGTYLFFVYDYLFNEHLRSGRASTGVMIGYFLWRRSSVSLKKRTSFSKISRTRNVTSDVTYRTQTSYHSSSQDRVKVFQSWKPLTLKKDSPYSCLGFLCNFDPQYLLSLSEQLVTIQKVNYWKRQVCTHVMVTSWLFTRGEEL